MPRRTRESCNARKMVAHGLGYTISLRHTVKSEIQQADDTKLHLGESTSALLHQQRAEHLGRSILQGLV